MAEQSEESLQNMAAALDAGGGVEPVIEGQPPKTEPTEAPPKPTDGEQPPKSDSDDGEKPPPTEARQRGPDGKFLPKAAPKAEDAPKPDDKPETAFDKAKKEDERQRSLLSKFEDEKKQVRDYAKTLEARERQLQHAEAQNMPRARLHGYTADEYLDAANKFAKDGDHENANKALIAAGQVQQFESQWYAQHQAQAQDAAFKSDMEKTLQEHKDLQDLNTPISQAVQKVLADFPEIYYLPNGFSKAHELAKRFMDADSVGELREKLEAAEKEVAKLRGATQPASGGPGSPPPGPRSFNQMTPAEQEADLQRKAEAADSQMAA